MKSVLWLCATVGAVSDASKCQADEATMLQGLNTVRLHSKKMPAKDTKSIFNNMRRVANSLVEGSDTPVSLDEVNDALDETAEALARMAPVFRQQLENAQQQIDDAISAFQGCQTTELRDDVGQHADAVESCTNTLDELRIAEAQQCDIAEDCLCDEARVRTTDHEALCASTTQTYEVAFCDHHAACNTLHRCHATEAEVYSRLRADVEAEMALLEEEYTIFEQVRCVTDLSREAITPPLSAIDPSASAACLDVDVSALDINYPAAPAPPTCPLPTGGPQCSSRPSGQFFRSLVGGANSIGSFVADAEVSGAGGKFLTRIDCASRVIRAHVQGGSCGDATVQFRIDDDTANYFKSGTEIPRNQYKWRELTDVTLVAGRVVRLPSQIMLDRRGWVLSSSSTAGRAPSVWGCFAASFKNSYGDGSSGWDRCNTNTLQGGETVTLECVGA